MLWFFRGRSLAGQGREPVPSMLTSSWEGSFGDWDTGETKTVALFFGRLSTSAVFTLSGHEAAFAAFLCCLCKIGVLRVDDQIAIVFKVFNR